MPQDEQQQSTTEGVEAAQEQVEQDSTGEAAGDSNGANSIPDGSAGETAGETPEGEGEGSPNGDSDLPEWAQKELRKVRAEAAQHRVALRAVEEQLETARKAGADVAAAQKVVDDLKGELAREKALRLHPVPEGLQQFVTATSEEEAIAQAKALAENAGKAAPRKTDTAGGGFAPEDDPTPQDPTAMARNRFRSRI